jgi:hypothetical protein
MRCRNSCRRWTDGDRISSAPEKVQILVDVRRLRVNAIKRIAFLRERDADSMSSLRTPKGAPMKNNTNEHRNAISAWEGEGGAGLSDQQSEVSRTARSALPNETALMRARVRCTTRTRRARSKRRDAIETISNRGLPPD